MNKQNLKIRLAIMEHSVRFWDVAKALGISESTFYRMMRDELPEDRQDEIVAKIEEVFGNE